MQINLLDRGTLVQQCEFNVINLAKLGKRIFNSKSKITIDKKTNNKNMKQNISH